MESDDFVICPYCEHAHDPTDFHGSEDFECEECGKEFHVEVDYATTYITTELEGS
jgi:transposase-like protein